MAQKFTQVDAFTDKPFGGNPAAICLLPQAGEATWMQQVAMEMNLAETAYLYRQDDGFNLRWFTPAVEVDLCGHATLASAHFLWEEGHLAADETARFYTRSGLLTAQRRGEWIELDFPTQPVEQVEAPAELLQALNTTPVWVGKNRVNYLVEVASEEIVRSLTPDMNLLLKLEGQGVIVTAKASTTGFDFVSRYFAPKAGINEDPVTGSAHCTLGVYWQGKLGKDEFMAYQASARGGVVGVAVVGDRIKLRGKAVTTLRGELV